MDSTFGSKEHMNFYAGFARNAYMKREDMSLPSGYEIDERHTNRNRVLHVNHEKKHAVYAFRGTDLVDKNKRVADLGTDVALAMGYGALTDRYKNGVRATKAVNRDYNGYTLDLTGHSLGASTAAHAHSKVKNTRYVGFSPHVPTNRIQADLTKNAVDKLTNKPRKKDSYVYTAAADPVGWGAALTYGKNAKVVAQTQRSPHSLDNFTA